MGLFRKTSPRRTQLRRSMSAERGPRIGRFTDTDLITSALTWLFFVVLSIPIVSFDLIQHGQYRVLVPTSVLVLLIAVAAGVYIWHYQERIVRNHARGFVLACLLILLLAVTKIGVLSTGDVYWATSWGTGAAIAAAIIMTIVYDQRFAIGMGAFYCLLACLTAGPAQSNGYQLVGLSLLVTMVAGVITCCFLLKEIRTRMKLLQVSVVAAIVVLVTAASAGFLSHPGREDGLSMAFVTAGHHALATFLVGLLIQSLLPVIEKVFRIATSMTLLDYSDANQPLLKRLAMEAPGTFSHSLLIGSIAEAAAESIGCSGLLCRVGAYYHDIGKLNKPRYFVENEMGSASRHKELSPAMSQLIIVGHVKDGIEMAKEYGLPSVLRQFIETHHGTTLIEPFYNEAKRQHEAPASGGPSARKPKGAPPRESEFRYAGPRPRTKEAGIVMLADAVEGAVRSLPEVTPAKVEAVVHNMAMKRLRDGQFDECALSLRELSQIEVSMAKTVAAHYHGRIAYPSAPDVPQESESQPKQVEVKK